MSSSDVVARHRAAGREFEAAMPERVASITLLNTMIEAQEFHRPWMMEPFARRGLGELWLASTIKPAFRQLMYLVGIQDKSATPPEEFDAYVELLKREDGGRAFLKVMRGFERTAAKQRLYTTVLRDAPCPVQVVWGAHDPTLKLATYGERAKRVTGIAAIHPVPGKHFPQEDQAPAIAERIAALARRDTA